MSNAIAGPAASAEGRVSLARGAIMDATALQVIAGTLDKVAEAASPPPAMPAVNPPHLGGKVDLRV